MTKELRHQRRLGSGLSGPNAISRLPVSFGLSGRDLIMSSMSRPRTGLDGSPRHIVQKCTFALKRDKGANSLSFFVEAMTLLKAVMHSVSRFADVISNMSEPILAVERAPWRGRRLVP